MEEFGRKVRPFGGGRWKEMEGNGNFYDVVVCDDVARTPPSFSPIKSLKRLYFGEHWLKVAVGWREARSCARQRLH